MKTATVLKWMHFWPPYFGAGVKVDFFNENITEIKVSLKMRWWNKNYVGTHFGGSLYSMIDPFYMFIFLKGLGKDFIVWDKAAHIKFIKPGMGRVTAEFKVTQEEIEAVKNKASNQDKYVFDKQVEIKNEQGDLVALATKTLYVRKK